MPVKLKRFMRVILVLSCTLLMAAMSGCVTVNSLPEVDLDEPGWKVTYGQALWKPGMDKPSLAGDLIAARHTNGDILINFAKPPIPIFTARTAGDLWQLVFVEKGKSYAGRGFPPKRFVWFLLPDLLAGAAAPEGWEMMERSADRVSLSNRKTGEEILVVIDR